MDKNVPFSFLIFFVLVVRNCAFTFAVVIIIIIIISIDSIPDNIVDFFVYIFLFCIRGRIEPSASRGARGLLCVCSASKVTRALLPSFSSSPSTPIFSSSQSPLPFPPPVTTFTNDPTRCNVDGFLLCRCRGCSCFSFFVRGVSAQTYYSFSSTHYSRYYYYYYCYYYYCYA